LIRAWQVQEDSHKGEYGMNPALSRCLTRYWLLTKKFSSIYMESHLEYAGLKEPRWARKPNLFIDGWSRRTSATLLNLWKSKIRHVIINIGNVNNSFLPVVAPIRPPR
jgi:hypothetical protein